MNPLCVSRSLKIKKYVLEYENGSKSFIGLSLTYFFIREKQFHGHEMTLICHFLYPRIRFWNKKQNISFRESNNYLHVAYFFSKQIINTDQLKISQPPDFLTMLHRSTGNSRRVIWAKIRQTNQGHVTIKNPVKIPLLTQLPENRSTMVFVLNAPPTLATFFAILDSSSMLIDIIKKITSRIVHKNLVYILIKFFKRSTFEFIVNFNYID